MRPARRLSTRRTGPTPATRGSRPTLNRKPLAERAAWDFIAREGNGLELSVINPVAVFGPVLSPDLSASVLLVQRLVSGKVPAVPRLSFGMVDARDVADLHVRAMTHPAAKGERFLAVAGEFMWILDMAKMLKARFGDAARNLPTRQVPNWMVRLAALRNVDARQIVSELGKAKSATSEKARRLLGWVAALQRSGARGDRGEPAKTFRLAFAWLPAR